MKSLLPDNPTYEDLAKLIDERGSISIKRILKPSGLNKSPQHWLEISIRSVDIDFLGKLKKYFDGTVTTHDRRSNRNVMYEWKIISNKAKRVLSAIKPYLDRQKSQAILGLEFTSLKSHGGKKLLSEEILDQRDEYRTKMIELNKLKRAK